MNADATTTDMITALVRLREALHTLESYVVMARATANTAVLDGRLLPIRAAKLIGILNDAVSGVTTGHGA